MQDAEKESKLCFSLYIYVCFERCDTRWMEQEKVCENQERKKKRREERKNKIKCNITNYSLSLSLSLSVIVVLFLLQLFPKYCFLACLLPAWLLSSSFHFYICFFFVFCLFVCLFVCVCVSVCCYI